MLAGVSDKLREAAQYAYDTRLSKPYTLTEIDWDWGYPDDSGPIWRPNHGLAHSARGAMYAPTVIDYFKKVTGSNDYDFSLDDIEKIQIALMFRVTGRENEGGFADYKGNVPNRYAEFQQQHGQNFREYCKTHPGIFKANEIEKYATLLSTYANPDAKSPLAIIFKTCHNLDLLRVRNPTKLSEELAIPTQILGTENMAGLMSYADSCLRATGNQITFANPIVGKGNAAYDDAVFRAVSTNVTECFKVILAVPLPPPPTLLPAKEMTLIKDVLLHYQVDDFKALAKPLLGEKSPVWILAEMKQLIEHPKLSADQKTIVANKCSALLAELIAAEVPPVRFKPLIDFFQAPIIDADTNPMVTTYFELMTAVQTQAPSIDLAEWGTGSNLAANKALLEAKAFSDKQAELAEKPLLTILSESIIEQDLVDGLPSSSAKDYADALLQRSSELFLNIRMNDIADPLRNLLLAQFQLFADKLTETVIQDILNAKSGPHLVNIAKYYYEIMQACKVNNDYHSAAAIFQALNHPAITRLNDLEASLSLQEKNDRASLGQWFGSGQQANYEKEVKSQNGPHVPSGQHLLETVNQTYKALKGGQANTGDQLVAVNSVFDAFERAQQLLIHAPKLSSDVDVSRIEGAAILSDAKRVVISQRIQPDVPFDAAAYFAEVSKSDYMSASNKLMRLLNDNLKIPTLLTFKEVSGTWKDQQAIFNLLVILYQLTEKALANQATLKNPKVCFQRIGIIALSIKEYMQNANLKEPKLLQRLTDIETKVSTQGISPADIETLREHQGKFKKWQKGGEVTLAQITQNVPEGPLPKNEFTFQYEVLMKGMLAGKIYTVQIINNSTSKVDEAVITMDGVDYNLAQIMKYANLNQLKLTEQDKKAYEKMVIDNVSTLKHKPGKPPSNTSVQSTKEVNDLIQGFDKADPSMKVLSKAERLAINIYTTSFYSAANHLLRNGAPNTALFADLVAVKELICHTGMAIHGLNAIPDTGNRLSVPDITFRGEGYYKPVMDKRVAAAATNGVTLEMGFISTAVDKPLESFSQEVGIVFKGAIGKNVKGLSAYSAEREVLMPPTQIQWFAYSKGDGSYLLQGKPVNTELGFAPEALVHFDAEKKKIEEAERDFSVDISLTTRPEDLLINLLTAPNLLKDHKGVLMDMTAVFKFMEGIFKDPLKVEAIVDNQASQIPALVNGGITTQYGLLNKFCEIAQVKHDENIKNKAKNEFKAALLATTSTDDLCLVIEKFAKNSHLEIGDGPVVKKMLSEIKGIDNDFGLMRMVASDPKVANALCGNIVDKLGIREHFVVLAKDKVQKMDNALQEIAQAKTIDELIVAVERNIQAGILPVAEESVPGKGKMEAHKAIIHNMRTFAANPDIVRGIAKAGAAALFFKQSHITSDYGIQDKYISFIRQIHQKNLKENAAIQVVNASQAAVSTAVHPGEMMIDSLLSKSKTNIIDEHDSLKKTMKGNKGWLPSIKTGTSFTDKGKLREGQMDELSKVFAIIKAQPNVSAEVKAGQAYAYLCFLKETIAQQSVDGKTEKKSSGLHKLCDAYITLIRNAVGDKVLANVDNSDWKMTANLLLAEIKQPAVVIQNDKKKYF